MTIALVHVQYWALSNQGQGQGHSNSNPITQLWYKLGILY